MAYTFRLGFGLRPGLMLLWDVEGALIERNRTAVSQTANLAALQMFITPRLFLKAGFGVAQRRSGPVRVRLGRRRVWPASATS